MMRFVIEAHRNKNPRTPIHYFNVYYRKSVANCFLVFTKWVSLLFFVLTSGFSHDFRTGGAEIEKLCINLYINNSIQICF